MFKDKKNIVILSILLLIVLAVSSYFIFFNKSTDKNQKKKEASVFEEAQEELIEVDKSVEITIKGKTEAEIKITAVPKGTSDISYQLSYNTKSGSVEGVFGSMDITDDEATKEITFGTCSSGACRYHEIDGPISGNFIFTGSYGERVRNQEFEL